MKILKQLTCNAIVLMLGALAACSTTTDPSDAYKGETAQQIFQGGEDALRDKSYAEAIKRFEALDVQYPFGRNAELAQLHIIYAYYKNSDYLSAEAAADRYIHAHPTSEHVDYAYYMRGLSNYYQNMGVFERLFAVDFATRDLTQVKKSFGDFSELASRFPHSPYAPAAHQYMIYLRNVLANHQVEVALYYFNHKAYIAAANRASMVVEHYQGSPAIPDALVMMAKSYHQLHQTQLEAQTLQVIRYNYPNSRYTQEITDSELSNSNFVMISKSEKSLPPQQALINPPTQVAADKSYFYQANGVRGTTTPVSDLVKEMQKSEFFATHGHAVAVSQKQAATQAQQAGGVSRDMPNAKSTNNTLTLRDILNKLGNTPLLRVHDKSSSSPADSVAAADAPQVASPVIPSNGMRR